MADENSATHYRVTVKNIFMAENEMFKPGDRYTVTADLYNSTIGNIAFKEMCETAQPIFKP